MTCTDYDILAKVADNPDNAGKFFFSIADLAQTGFASEWTIRRLIHAGELPASRVSSGRYVIKRDDLAIYIHEHMVKAGE